MKIDIIGGGISGLSLAFLLLQQRGDLDVTVFEADTRVGGKIWTERAEGFVCEAGVNGFLDNKPATLRLSGLLNLSPLRSSDIARRRFICLDGRLKEIPEKPLSFMLSNFLSLSGRLNMVAEYFRPPAVKEDESMESFAIRRVGREFFEKLLDPMASGVYAGDPARLSIRSCFTKVYELEKNYGSLIKGFMAIARQKKKAGQRAEAGPGGVLHSFDGGMYSLIEKLREALGERVKTGASAQSIEKTKSGYKTFFQNGTISESEIVVIATPAHETTHIVKGFDRALSETLSRIPYPPLSVVSLGFRSQDISNIDLRGFGFLVPAREGRKILGTLYDTSIFPKRAPEGQALLRVMIGGARYTELALLEDKPLIDTALNELRQIMGLRAEPSFVRIYRWKKAIPQYNVGHHRILDDIDSRLQNHKGLFLTGNAYRGVAVNDCIANSHGLCEEILRGL